MYFPEPCVYLAEPNNWKAPEYCAVANATQAYTTAWGWSDQNCDDKYIFMCKIAPSPPPSPHSPPPSPAPPPPKGSPIYYQNSTGYIFVYHAEPLTFNDAQATCLSDGGSLVTYDRLAKQQDVESTFAQRGISEADRNPFYWIGLYIAPYTDWPNFRWLNGLPGPNNWTYSHWGTYKPGTHLEPNNVFPPELCSGANATETFGGAWGWGDENCDRMFPFICEVVPPNMPPPTPAPPTGMFNYTIQAPSKIFKAVSFVLNTELVDYSTAEARCEAMAGYLVSYEDLEEQIEVEGMFLSQNALDMTYYNRYWIGLRVPPGRAWPYFEWAVPPVANWSHWGNFTPGSIREPNNLFPKELCALANASEAFAGAWGWADERCSIVAPYVCKVPQLYVSPSPPPMPPLPSPPPSPRPAKPSPPRPPNPPPPRPSSPRPPPPIVKRNPPGSHSALDAPASRLQLPPAPPLAAGRCSPYSSEELFSSIKPANCISNAAKAQSSLTSADKRYMLTLQTGGSLQFFDALASQTLWNITGAAQAGTSTLCILDNGNLALTGPNGKTVWSSGTGSSANTGDMHLDVAEGNLVVKDRSCRVTWMAPFSECRACLPIASHSCCVSPHTSKRCLLQLLSPPSFLPLPQRVPAAGPWRAGTSAAASCRQTHSAPTAGRRQTSPTRAPAAPPAGSALGKTRRSGSAAPHRTWTLARVPRQLRQMPSAVAQACVARTPSAVHAAREAACACARVQPVGGARCWQSFGSR
jgi:hypothetical protein